MTNSPAVAKMPASDGKRLHAFTALPSPCMTILGPRRTPAVKAPIGNSDTYIQIFTSNGFKSLSNTDYIAAIKTIKPDIAIPLADMHSSLPRASQAKGIRRMCERTEDWMAELHKSLDLDDLRASNTSIFAPTLPVPYPMQWEYLNRLSSDFVDKLSGLTIYDVDILPELINYPSLMPLPRLSVDTPADPHEILRQISLGADTFLLPFINIVSDAGVAMTFTFPPPSTSPSSSSPSSSTTTNGTNLLPLGVDLSLPGHATSLSSLVDNCPCYTCTSHHRAYLHHLLNAREMLAWTLLQIHNHHILSHFFTGIRSSLAAGAENFEQDCRRFYRTYEADLPAGLGTRPRARGYHFKSEHGDERRNKLTWKQLQEAQLEKAEVVEGMLAKDVIETPVVPGEDVDAVELIREGLGEVDIKKD